DARRARRLRRRLPHVRRGDRPLLPRGESRLGALVRPGGDRPPPVGRAHRRALPDAADALALAQRPPLRAQAPGAAPSAPVSKYDREASHWTEEAYADAQAYLEHRADLVISLGVPLGPGDR